MTASCAVLCPEALSRGRAVCCPRAVRPEGYFGPVAPNGQGDRSTYRVPNAGTAQVPPQSKNSDDAMFHTEKAGLLSK
eukprot:CAMPEP_0174369796 /NCGR_PEP_ID=MMETSP0811_2-20130205/93792_1 /TAXON_ID=73025 ORGANISM="Eutreptiella gymnastica-like, Strain CCMP1594" /NCGR_SAMPLE_ID=MMETSP0811_2 /ASSEMBLY_ACC=CAM_ASM_000667 /LENGTH=77 /DNA_ID=CAMNT_0015514613 /DNA_START=35 /DNA_END=266 /DNA_ORIENTATION=-